MNLKEYQKLWHSGLSGESEIKEISDKLGLNPLAIETYANMVDYHYVSAMKKIYIHFSNLYSGDFEQLIWEYYKSYPPTDWDLNGITQYFSEYLDQREDIPKYLVELAEYEWGEFFVYQYKDLKKVSGYQLNPAISLHVFNYDIPSWVLEIEDEDNIDIIKKSEIKKKEVFLVIARNPETNLPVFTQSNLLMMHLIQKIREKSFCSLSQLKEDLLSLNIDKAIIDQQVDLMFLQNILIVQ